jgi:hypothetical protein
VTALAAAAVWLRRAAARRHTLLGAAVGRSSRTREHALPPCSSPLVRVQLFLHRPARGATWRRARAGRRGGQGPPQERAPHCSACTGAGHFTGRLEARALPAAVSPRSPAVPASRCVPPISGIAGSCLLHPCLWSRRSGAPEPRASGADPLPSAGGGRRWCMKPLKPFLRKLEPRVERSRVGRGARGAGRQKEAPPGGGEGHGQGWLRR